MKRIFLSILLFTFVCVTAQAQMIQGSVVGSTGAACNYTGCSAGCKLFDWDCSTASMASNTCSLGDTSATLEGEADLTTNAGFVTMLDTSDNGNDNYKFSMSSYDIFPAGDVTVEIKFNLSVAATGANLFYVYLDSNNYFSISISGATRDILVRHRGNGATLVDKTFDVNITLSADHTIIVKAGANGMALSVDGGAYETDATKTITTMTHSGTGTNAVSIGNDNAYNMEGKIDYVRISAGWRTDI